MKVASWYWKVVFLKKDNMPILRVDFYGEDKLQGAKQLFLYIMQEDDRAYRQITSLLQGVKVRKIDSVKELNGLCRTVKVTMLNINYGKNQMLMNACEPLKEYAWLVDSIRQKQKTLKDLEVTVDAAIEEMPREFVIRGFLLQNKVEVKGMFLTEYDQDKVLAQERREVGYRVAVDMLRDGEPLEKIKRYSRLAEEVIQSLANGLGVDKNLS